MQFGFKLKGALRKWLHDLLKNMRGYGAVVKYNPPYEIRCMFMRNFNVIFRFSSDLSNSELTIERSDIRGSPIGEILKVPLRASIDGPHVDEGDLCFDASIDAQLSLIASAIMKTVIARTYNDFDKVMAKLDEFRQAVEERFLPKEDIP